MWGTSHAGVVSSPLLLVHPVKTFSNDVSVESRSPESSVEMGLHTYCQAPGNRPMRCYLSALLGFVASLRFVKRMGQPDRPARWDSCC